MSNYNITEEITSAPSKKHIDTGISENLELSHRVETSLNGNAFLEFTYTNENGQSVKRTEWEVNPLPALNAMSSKQQQMITNLAEKAKVSMEAAREMFTQININAQMKRIINVAKHFVPENELKGQNFNSFKEFITFISNKIGTKCNGVKLRVKFVYDRKGWVNTPEYVDDSNPWIERMDKVPTAEESKIIIKPSDKMERSQPSGSRAPKVENDLSDPDSDDLPF